MCSVEWGEGRISLRRKNGTVCSVEWWEGRTSLRRKNETVCSVEWGVGVCVFYWYHLSTPDTTWMKPIIENYSLLQVANTTGKPSIERLGRSSWKSQINVFRSRRFWHQRKKRRGLGFKVKPGLICETMGRITQFWRFMMDKSHLYHTWMFSFQLYFIIIFCKDIFSKLN